MFSKVLIANRGEIAVRIIRACEELGVATVAVYSELDRDAPHVKRADEAYPARPGPGPESYLVIDKLLEVIERPAPRRSIPGTGSWPRTPRSRPRSRRRGHVHRAARVGDRGDGIEDPGARADAEGRRADRARDDRAGGHGRGCAEGDRRDDRLSGRGQGGGRRRRQGLPRRPHRGQAAGCVRGGRSRGREVLRRLDGVPGALPARPAPRRGAGAGRQARQRDPPRRARLLAPAPPSEADRGGAGARRSTRSSARRSERSPPTPPRRSTTPAPARSRVCSRTASTSSWR